MYYLDGYYSTVGFNKTEILQSILNIENKSRSNPLTWKAQFSPQFVEAILKKYAKEGFVIFDPFLGSGTVLLEAGRLGLAAFGTEINPAAVILSRFYEIINLSNKDREEIVEIINNHIVKKINSNDNIQNIFYSFNKFLSRLKQNYWIKIVFETLIILSDFHNTKNSTKKIEETWWRLSKIIRDLPHSESKIRAYHSDARKIPIESDSIDLVITSPPYINVYNYHQQYRKSAEYLKWDILKVAKSEIGSNRKHRSNRFLTVIQYCLDIEAVFLELLRVCKINARVIFIVGRESNIRGTPFNNSELVAEIAYQRYGLKLLLKQERVFTNRFGKKIYEDILHFKIEKSNHKINFTSRLIAKKALNKALSYTADNNINLIKDALLNLNKINQSFLLNK